MVGLRGGFVEVASGWSVFGCFRSVLACALFRPGRPNFGHPAKLVSRGGWVDGCRDDFVIMCARLIGVWEHRAIVFREFWITSGVRAHAGTMLEMLQFRFGRSRWTGETTQVDVERSSQLIGEGGFNFFAGDFVHVPSRARDVGRASPSQSAGRFEAARDF